MNMNFEFNLFNVIILIINIALIAIYVLNSIKLTKLRKNYSDFMTKLGKGNNINEMLQEYVKSVDEIKKENNESSNTITENIVQEENNKDNYEFPNIDLDNKKDDVILSSDKTIDNEGFWPVKDIDISVLGIDNLE